MKTILTVTKFTFIEVYRSKIMYSLLFMAIGLVVITYIASEFAYGAPAKVALDVGLGLLSLSNIVIAIFIGSTLLNKEIEQRTLYMILSRPLSRASFLVGKTLGLSVILFMNSLFLVMMTVSMYKFLGGTIDNLIFWSALFSFIEALMVLLFAVLFSLVTNTTMSVIYSIVVFAVGHALNETLSIIFVKLSPFLTNILKAATFIVPHYYQLNLKDFVLYRQDISWNYLIGVMSYSFCYILFLYFLIAYVFNRKNLD